ncbi:MAG: ATP-dependent Clp protease proteolytic subunit [Saprospiraceae bacterium]|nr:ATP-dependent Clp protease proteolytic subunit [Saprospiraceae bacterium]
MTPIFDKTISEILIDRLCALEDHFKSDVLFYFGEIRESVDIFFRDVIEELREENRSETICIILNTPGGSAETVEKLVRIIRYHYKEVYFIVPDAAYSAGTIFCMSGDRIYMDYSSALGPIDPQVFNGKNWVPALGYLDKADNFIEKSAKGTLTTAELVMLKELDLALLRRYEQAKDLTIDLLKGWLVKYKFKNWNNHSSTGKKVTIEEKEARAKEVATCLGDNKTWHSHGRPIGIIELTQIVKLKIEDYSSDTNLKQLIRNYNDLICQYVIRTNSQIFIHTRQTIL